MISTALLASAKDLSSALSSRESDFMGPNSLDIMEQEDAEAQLCKCLREQRFH